MRYLWLVALAVALSLPLPVLAQGPGNSCYSFRGKGSDQWQIACYPDAAGCKKSLGDYTAKNKNLETLGCAPQIYCFTYNTGGKSSACYLDVNACTTERGKMAAKGGVVNGCVNNTRPGTPSNTGYGQPANCFAYYEPGSITPTVVCSRNAAACTQSKADKLKYLKSKGATANELNMIGDCGGPLYCLNTGFKSGGVNSGGGVGLSCFATQAACDSEHKADAGRAYLGACTLNDYQGTNPPKS
jgi:hypothetical protein